MRVIAVLLSLGLLGLAAWNGRGLWQQLQTPLSETRVLSAAVPTANPDNAVARLQVRRWPALFGQFQRPEPQPPKPPEPPQPPQPPKPQIESLGYRLQGVVRNGSANWAIVNHPTGDVILRVGDSLVEGVTVVGISAEGLWLQRDGERLLLGFETQSP
mgnify:CR=1 FL=1